MDTLVIALLVFMAVDYVLGRVGMPADPLRAILAALATLIVVYLRLA